MKRRMGPQPGFLNGSRVVRKAKNERHLFGIVDVEKIGGHTSTSYTTAAEFFAAQKASLCGHRG